MAKQWKDRGHGEDLGELLMDAFTGGALGETRVVEDPETGSLRKVFVADGQDLGDAIAKGQFVDE